MNKCETNPLNFMSNYVHIHEEVECSCGCKYCIHCHNGCPQCGKGKIEIITTTSTNYED